VKHLHELAGLGRETDRSQKHRPDGTNLTGFEGIHVGIGPVGGAVGHF
jgi:hypothetical protein